MANTASLDTRVGKPMKREKRIIAFVQKAAYKCTAFEPRGQGKGNHATNEAMKHANGKVESSFGRDVYQRRLNKANRQTVDYYLEDEETVIEVEFRLSTSYPCLEKDAFKALLGRADGKKASLLLLIGDPGSEKKMAAPAPKSIIAILRREYRLEVVVHELKATSDS